MKRLLKYFSLVWKTKEGEISLFIKKAEKNSFDRKKTTPLAHDETWKHGNGVLNVSDIRVLENSEGEGFINCKVIRKVFSLFII